MGAILVLVTIGMVYFAGSYHEASLLLLAVTLLLAELALDADAVYRWWAYKKRKVSVGIFANELYLVQGQWKPVVLKADNRLLNTQWVSGRVQVLDAAGKAVHLAGQTKRRKLSAKWASGRTKGRKLFPDQAAGRFLRRSIRFTWRIDCGEHAKGMEVRIAEPGNYRLVLDRFRIHDGLGVFSIPGGEKLEVQLSVYQVRVLENAETTAEFALSQMGARDRDAHTDTAADNSMEIKGIREYRPEDSVRHIHWKISARLGKLQRKEYFNQNVECPEPKAQVRSDCPVKKTDRPESMLRWETIDQKSFWGVGFLTLVCGGLLYALFYGYHVHAETVFVIVLGWILLQIRGSMAGRDGLTRGRSDRRASKNRHIPKSQREPKNRRGAAFWGLELRDVWRGLAFGSVVFALALAAVLVVRSGIYEMVFRTEKFLNQVIEDESAKYRVPRTSGRIAMGNRYTTGREMIWFSSTRKLEETMYLRGFVGGRYENGVWKSANDQSILQSDDITSETNSFQGMHYTLNRFSPEGSRQETDLHIVHSNGKYDATTLYTPYFSQWMSFYYTEDDNPTWDQWYGLGKGYVYKCFEKHQMHVDWEKIDEIYAYRAQKLKRIQQEYLEAVYEEYTAVPEGLERLQSVVEVNPKENVDEVTDFILSFLSEQAVYTTEPGRFTRGKDLVEQFLFEKHEGYCVHYASAAVLMYRMYGIPARYAAGYYVPVERMERDDRLGVVGTASDEQAHAWAEIYLDDYGWMPVEVTYDAMPNLEIQEPYPGYGSGQSTVYGKLKIADEGNKRTDMDVAQARRGDGREDIDEDIVGTASLVQEDDLAHFSVLGELWKQIFQGEYALRNRVMAAVFIGYLLVVIMPTVWIFHRQDARMRIQEGSCGYVYGQLLRLCEKAAKRAESNAQRGQNAPMAQIIPMTDSEVFAACGLFAADEVRKILKIAEKNAFSAQGADETEKSYLKKMYFRAYACSISK